MSVSNIPITTTPYNENDPYLHIKTQLSAEVVLVHCCNNDPSKSVLYQLPNGLISSQETAESIRDAFFNRREVFTSLGYLASINKQKKHLTLSDGCVVTYQYLIIISTSSSSISYEEQHKKFSPGVRALLSALLIKEKLNFSFTDISPSKETHNTVKHSFEKKSPFFEMSKITHKIVEGKQKASSNLHPHYGSAVIC